MEFKNEKQEREEQFAKLQEAAEKKFVDSKLIKEKGMDLFQEDWQLSQFWVSFIVLKEENTQLLTKRYSTPTTRPIYWLTSSLRVPTKIP